MPDCRTRGHLRPSASLNTLTVTDQAVHRSPLTKKSDRVTLPLMSQKYLVAEHFTAIVYVARFHRSIRFNSSHNATRKAELGVYRHS